MSSPDTDVLEASRRYFNEWATRYDRSWTQIWFRENHRLIVQAMAPPADARILDLCRDNLFMGAFDQLQRWLQPSHAGIASTTEMRRYYSRALFRRLQITKPRWLLMLAQGTLGGGSA